MPNTSRPGLVLEKKLSNNLTLYLGFAVAVLFFILSGFNALRNTRALRDGMVQMERANTVISVLDSVRSLMKDAETGQRGFLITGDEKYLQPYYSSRTGIDVEVARLKEFSKRSTAQANVIPQVEAQIASKLEELEETIQLRRGEGFEAARAVVLTDRGKQTMDDLRDNLELMKRQETRVKDLRTEEMEAAHRLALTSGFTTAALGIFLSFAVMWLIRRANIVRMWQDWSQKGRLELSAVMSGEKSMGPLAESILGFLSRYVDAHAGAVFAARGGLFERVAMVGAPASHGIPERFSRGEGLLGQAVVERAPRRIDDVPESYLRVGSALGEGLPKHLLILPATTDDSVNAVIELGFLAPLDARKQEFLQQVSEMVGVGIKSALYREHLQDLLEETQRQSEEVQAQSEELRVSNEELDEQSRMLKETQVRLELQQTELEQTNVQLEEQTHILGRQKDDLVTAKINLEAKAREVEQASRYKADFLANMSHELRTPLNSSLILAKLLAENAAGNLTSDQVKYASTIESAGKDLLNLINDILDLSKIEAGHMEMNVDSVKVRNIISNLSDTFTPIASQKSLELVIDAGDSLASVIETDSQRLEQVLKNLLSNALKFTDTGFVRLQVRDASDGRLAFVVMDTGIGIAPDKQRAIFDPFLQADGTTSRKYGGTGLGLSISRNLARLLGGEITLESEPGKGSMFAVLIPRVFRGPTPRPHVDGSVERPRPTPVPEQKKEAVGQSRPVIRVEDDRERLSGDARVILIAEDDANFSEVVQDLAHELGFESIIAPTAEEALLMTKQYSPHAIVLDIGLPDNSGLTVLERLKADPRTRHIPVHVVSASDYSETALALGAVGYMLKPVKRDQLADAFRRLETRFTQKMRRVLVVEDDPVQVDAMRDLLGSRDVDTMCVQTAAECLEQLRTTTFDCMVLDLSLPDASGFALLETLREEEAYSFPPVIVYTGRVLSQEEEQRLRKYSKSIIIKGAKSPERLLDEVTLFLHQVVSDLPPEKQRMIEKSASRDAVLEGRCILIAEDDVRNVFALTSILEGRGVNLRIARNGREAISVLEATSGGQELPVDLVLMDVMMPEMDGITAMKEIRKHREWSKLPIIALTAKAMPSDQQQCMDAGANDYLAKPLDVEKLLSLIRVWMPR